MLVWFLSLESLGSPICCTNRPSRVQAFSTRCVACRSITRSSASSCATPKRVLWLLCRRLEDLPRCSIIQCQRKANIICAMLELLVMQVCHEFSKLRHMASLQLFSVTKVACHAVSFTCWAGGIVCASTTVVAVSSVLYSCQSKVEEANGVH